MTQCVAPPSQQAGNDANPAAHAPSQGEVLVVDDTAASLAYLCDLLTMHGYDVRAAPNGELALWTAASRRPDLILLDVRMPDLSGFEVCRRLKADPRTATVPVIFLSAQNDIEDKIQGFQAGGVDYVGKPFASEEVLQRVATHLKLARVTQELEYERAQLESRVQERTAQLECTTAALRAEVAAHHQAEQQLRLTSSAFEASLSSMCITDTAGVMVAVNAAFTEATGYAPADCLGQNISLLNSHKHDAAFFQQMWSAIRHEGRWTGELWNRRKDGNVFPCLHTIAAVKNPQGDTVNYVSVFLDLSETKDAQTLIEFLTHHDPLTGLPNRVLVRDRFNRLISQPEHDELIAVVCINLDRFRHINDFYGHALGNQVLQWVARQLTENLPSKDTVFREGADEFVLVHRERAGLLGVRMLIETLQTRLNTELTLDQQAVALSVSLGVAVYPSDGHLLEDLVSNAALAMARAKERGGGNYAFFTEKLDHGVRVRFDLAQRLHHALEQNEFAIHYQPQLDSHSGRIVAAEALLRWTSPERGVISPAQFIPVAEETGSIVKIGAWVLQQVCQQIARWRQQGLGDVKVAVNLSAVQFMRQDIGEIVAQALDASGIPPACLELEITESALIDDVTRAIATMRQLKAIGVTLSLDDFGTGYSSLSYLKKFPIDFLKIDQTFVRDLIHEADADAIVRSIISLAHNMRMQVIAEGVETPAQRDFLVTQGCDVLQGYLFSRPVAEAEFRRCLLTQRMAEHAASPAHPGRTPS